MDSFASYDKTLPIDLNGTYVFNYTTNFSLEQAIM